VSTTSPPPGQSELTIVSTDEFQYKGKCQVSGGTNARDQAFFRDARKACKLECMSENTEGIFSAGEVGSECKGFSFLGNTQDASKNNCIIHRESKILPQNPAAINPAEGQWECWEIKSKQMFKHHRQTVGPVSDQDKPVTDEVKTFRAAWGLDGGYMARRFKVQALQQTMMDCFKPYIWIEIEDEPISRRLSESWKWWGNFWSSQVTGGTKGFIPVSQQEWDDLVSCLAVSGSLNSPAHVVTTERICVDMQDEGHCIREVLELTCIWIALLVGALCFLLGWCCAPRAAQHEDFEIEVKKVRTKAGPGIHNMSLAGANAMGTVHFQT